MNQQEDFNPKKKVFFSFRVKQVISFFAIVVSGTLFIWIVSNFLTPEQWNWYWKLAIIYFIPPAGKETIIPAGLGLASSIGIGVPIPAFIWGLSIWVLDFLTCLIIITNWWIIELLISVIPAFPFIGIRLKKKPRVYKTKISLKTWYDGLHRKTKELEAKKYGKILPIALFLFMFIPFQGTGAMSTTILGTWLGLRPRITILIVAIGSFLTISFMISVLLGILKIWT